MLDEVIPHPVNPGADTEDVLKELLAEGHARAKAIYEKQRTKAASSE